MELNTVALFLIQALPQRTFAIEQYGCLANPMF